MATLTPLDRLLTSAAAARASDVHISADAPALMRVDGELMPVPGGPDTLSAAFVESALLEIMSDDQLSTLETLKGVDLAHQVPGVGRFRVNAFRQLGGMAAAFRLVPAAVFSLNQLGIPAVARELALKPRGLVLVTGPTGSGKSTTLAAMVDIINRSVATHIITVEDPIEYVHTSQKALIHQREIGEDTPTFADALRHVLRQDPDVILIGELRDQESISTALTAAETGHLVLGTLHTQGAAKSIDRIIDSFPAHQQNQIRAQLADTLQGVVSQTLLPRYQTDGRVPATEVLVHTTAVANLIREGQIQQLPTVMQSSAALGMHTLDQSLRELVEQGLVARQVAQGLVVDPKALDGVWVQANNLDAEAFQAHLSSLPAENWEF